MPDDRELDALRAAVTCSAVLENLTAVWRFDACESTRNALKYRSGPGEVLIVNHDGKGWWDPLSDAKGDVFDLVQHLYPDLNFGEVRKKLRPLVGLTPSYRSALPRDGARKADRPVASRWSGRPRLRPGSPAWTYLHEQRALSGPVLQAAAAADVVREGPHGSAWFAHRDNGTVTHVEIRGSAYKGSLSGGHKALFLFQAHLGYPRRLVIAEAPIDALSLAVLEPMRGDTLYAATGGGMGPGTLRALEGLLAAMARVKGAEAASAADANDAGERFARRHAELAAAAGVAFVRLRPPDNLDWNDVLTKGRNP